LPDHEDPISLDEWNDRDRSRVIQIFSRGFLAIGQKDFVDPESDGITAKFV
jgi:hypothetical protein